MITKIAGSWALLLGILLNACLRPDPQVVRGPDDRISLRGALLYHRDAPFTGTLEENHPDGSLHLRVHYLEGRRHGRSLAFYPGGNRMERRVFDHGKKTGTHVGWWQNGQKRFEYHFHRGTPQGVSREWYANGAPAREMHYAQGVESGIQRAWRPNGTLFTNYEAKNGRQYGVINARMCYSVEEGEGVYAKGP